MALFYSRNTIVIEGKNVSIRPIRDDDDYVVGITMDSEGDEEVNELLLTREEVDEITDAAFNQ